MAQQTERFKAFVKLGTFFREFARQPPRPDETDGSLTTWLENLHEKVRQAGFQNAWFTRENITRAIAAWGETLNEENLTKWLKSYQLENNRPKKVAVIMAGNIPLVGFHDFLSVLITGNSIQAKLSSNDRILLPFVAAYLSSVAPGMQDTISFAEGPLHDYDAVIATGSNNTSRYFEYYFRNKPHIIRMNRNSVAVLRGHETASELFALGTDIFAYFGLGCRNVSKIYVPENYDFQGFLDAVQSFSEISNHNKYVNNYDYNKAVYLMNGYPILDNGFLILREDTSFSSPIGTLHFEYYKDPDRLSEHLSREKEKIQCIAGRKQEGFETAFGKTQSPALWEYADDVDTVDFLLKT